MAVNLGDDAAATGAVYGQIPRVCYGEDGIPQEWRLRIVERDRIVDLADGLHATSFDGNA